jgi:tetratricopeptide (TPR) repeat protein
VWFIRSINIGPNVSPIPYNNLARVSLRNKAADAAFEILRDAKKRFGDNPDTLFMLAVCYNRVGMYDAAIAQIRGLVGSGNATPEIHCLLSALFFEGKGDYKTGLQIAKDAAKRFRDHDVVANMLAYAYLLTGDAASARRIIEAHIDKDDEQWTHPSTRVTFTATFGLLRILEGDFREGTRLYKKAEKMCSQLGLRDIANVVVQKMHLELARAHIRNQDFKAAIEEVREGLATRDGNLQYEQHLQALERQLSLNNS